MTYKFSKGHAMNDQNASATQAQHGMPRVAARNSRLSRITRGLLASVGFVALLIVVPATAQAGPTYLGTAENYAVLAASAVSCPTASTVTGNLGISPNGAGSVSGFPAPCTLTGVLDAANAAALQAQNDLTTAYNALSGLACTTDLTGQDLGGLTLTPGVYCFSTSAQLTGTLTLNALGNPNAVFIFKMGSTLTTAPNASVIVTNGGATSSCGVSWQVGSSATLDSGTTFLGNIVALTSITTITGASVSGRLLARNGAVTIAGDVDDSACVGGAYTATGLPGAGSGVPPATATSVPTLSEWAMIMLVALLAMTGFVAMRRQV